MLFSIEFVACVKSYDGETFNFTRHAVLVLRVVPRYAINLPYSRRISNAATIVFA